MYRSPRILAYDAIKTLAIFLVVLYHVGGMDYGSVIPSELYIPNLNKLLSTFFASSVPLFFMVNGALILPRHLSLKQLLRKSAKLVLLYIFGKVVLQYLLCQQLLGIPHDMVHFWFLLTLASLYPISYILDRYPLFKKIVLVGLFLCPFITNLLGDIIAFFFPAIELSRFVHTGLFTLYSLVYFYLGSKLRDSNISISVSIILLLIGFLFCNFEVIAMSSYLGQVFDSGNALFPTFGAACMSISLFSILKGCEIRCIYLRNVICIIGRNTLGIFMLHVLLLYWARKYISEWMSINCIYSVGIGILVAFVSLGISCLLNSLIKHEKKSWTQKDLNDLTHCNCPKETSFQT